MKNEFLTYSSIMLAGEDAFLRLVRHGENETVWKAWLVDHPEFRNTFDDARRIAQAMEATPQAKISQADKKQLWENISDKLSSETHKTKTPAIRKLWAWGLAAAASLALLFWFGSDAGKTKTYAEAGKHKEVVLPEKSVVTLNADSRMIYESESFNERRVLHLKGEAFFDVEPGSSFTVLTDEGIVTVLGTSFNVVARDGKFEVSCYTGKVSVARNAQNTVVITTGQQVSAENKNLRQENFDASSGNPEWIQGVFRFENQPLKEVIAELERQYDIHVQIEKGLEETAYTGLFESGDIDEALKLITWPLHLKTSKKGETIIISR